MGNLLYTVMELHNVSFAYSNRIGVRNTAIMLRIGVRNTAIILRIA